MLVTFFSSLLANLNSGWFGFPVSVSPPGEGEFDIFWLWIISANVSEECYKEASDTLSVLEVTER